MARRLILPLLGGELMFTAHRYLPALLLSAGVLLAAPACASYGYGYQRGGVSRDVERRAYDRGYREGVKAGGAVSVPETTAKLVGNPALLSAAVSMDN